MGNNSTKEKIIYLNQNELKLVRTSWNMVKCSNEYKSYGTTLMVKLVCSFKF